LHHEGSHTFFVFPQALIKYFPPFVEVKLWLKFKLKMEEKKNLTAKEIVNDLRAVGLPERLLKEVAERVEARAKIVGQLRK
jgi:hypothetical protein